jgi:hypothetical protein
MSEQTKISVTLKINKSSVMLYSSQYVKLTGQGGATAQRYLGSFPVTATEVPASFESLLREGTRGRPERYRALMLRIENEVLVPAKIRKEQEERQSSREAVVNAMQWAAQNLRAIPEMPHYAALIGRPDLQSFLTNLLDESARLSRDVQRPETERPAVVIEDPEVRLQRLLALVETACTEIAAVMPESALNFKRGYGFQSETVERVQRLWFRTSDAIAALSARSQFRRPSQWSNLRSTVLGE